MTTISLITVTCNAGSTLSHCLASVAMQSVAPVEHRIVDGCSTDNTLELTKYHTGHQLQVVSEPDNGIYDAMNKGLRQVTGEVVGILNADDFYAGPDVLKEVTAVFADPSVQACYGDLCYVDCRSPGKIVRYWRSGRYDFRRFYWGWMPPHPTFFVRRAVYLNYGLFNLDLGSAADYELMLRYLLRHRLPAAYIPQVLVKMRTGGVSNVALANRLQANRMDRKAWVMNGLRPYPWTLTMKPLRKFGQWLFTKPSPGA